MRKTRGRFVGAQASLLLTAILLMGAFPGALNAAISGANLECGQPVQQEFTEPYQVHVYRITMRPGQKMELQAAPVGKALWLRVIVLEPAGQALADSEYQEKVSLQGIELSATGLHTIKVYNSKYGPNFEDEPTAARWGDTRQGMYTLSVTCSNSDGSWIPQGAPGGTGVADSAAPPAASAGAQDPGSALGNLGKYAAEVQKVQSAVGAATQAVQLISGVADLAKGLKLWGKKKGAQGAPEVPAPAYQRPEDMMAKGQQPHYAQPVETSPVPAPQPAAPSVKPSAVDRQTFPVLGLGTLLQGEITATTGAQGCRFQAKAGQGIDLKFERLTGDQGLMITVFAPDQRPVYLTSVLASPKIATTLQFPVAGEYTVEVAAVGPASGSPARFSLQLAAASK